jgi:hypothetical protein
MTYRGLKFYDLTIDIQCITKTEKLHRWFDDGTIN